MGSMFWWSAKADIALAHCLRRPQNKALVGSLQNVRKGIPARRLNLGCKDEQITRGLMYADKAL